MKKNFEKVVFVALIILGFLLIISRMSGSLDYDLGWHLRFGKEAVSGAFPFTDTYTWTHKGMFWANHEWGGDILLWKIFESFGYNGLLIFTGIFIWLAFLLVPTVFGSKLSVRTIPISIYGAWTVSHLTTMRLATLSPFFIFLVWYTVKHLNRKPLYWFWPLIFWIWSTVHGSWVLGFVYIGLYMGIEVGKKLYSKIFKKQIDSWSWKTIWLCSLNILISMTLISISPYGLRIWPELFSYYSISDYKTMISEWRPSYYYPIYIRPLIISLLGGVALWTAFKKKWAKAEDILLFVFLFIIGTNYRRQALFVVMFSTAILAKIASELDLSKFNIFFNSLRPKQKYYIASSLLFSMFLLILGSVSDYHFTRDVWSDRYYQFKQAIPIDATNYLNKLPIENKKIFNDFGMGGYLSWKLPTSTLIYFDGRGGSTWMHSPKESEIKYYMHLLTDEGGLNEIKNYNVDYIILTTVNLKLKNYWNKQIYPDVKFQKNKLLTGLEGNNTDWKLIYSDQVASIWERAK